MKTYFDLMDGSALIERTDTGEDESFRLLNKRDGWIDAAGLVEQYFYDGEPGAEEISAEQAAILAKKLGSSL